VAVKIRHLAATPVGRRVRAISRVIEIDPKSVVFEVEAWDGDRKIGDGTHRRGIVNVVEFEERFGVKHLAMNLASTNLSSRPGRPKVISKYPVRLLLRVFPSCRKNQDRVGGLLKMSAITATADLRRRHLRRPSHSPVCLKLNDVRIRTFCQPYP